MFERDPQSALFDVTPIENLFIQEYMPEAKGDYVKVYLAMAYAVRFSAEYTTDAMADALNLPVETIEAALRFWERRGLLQRVADKPPRYMMFAATQRMATGGQNRADDDFVQFSDDMYALCRSRRDLHASEISQTYEWVTDLKLPREVVLMLVDHLMRTRGPKCSLKQGDALAVAMKEQSVITSEDVEAFFAREQGARDGARAVLRCLGKRRQPSEPEIDQYTVWTRDWGFTHDAILAACSETLKGEPTMGYLGGILRGMRQRAGQAAQSSQQADAQIQREKETRDAVAAFYRALGMRVSAIDDALTAQYQALRELYPDNILVLAAREVQRAGGSTDGVRATLTLWKNMGYQTQEDIQSYLDQAHATSAAMAAVMSACGISGIPTGADRKRYKKWSDMGFSHEMLLLAAERTRMAGAKIPYLEKILQSWQAAGVFTPEAAAAQTPPAQQRGVSPRKLDAQQYTQREYGPEKDLLISPEILREVLAHEDGDSEAKP